jgi:hypothetical protein
MNPPAPVTKTRAAVPNVSLLTNRSLCAFSGKHAIAKFLRVFSWEQ